MPRPTSALNKVGQFLALGSSAAVVFSGMPLAHRVLEAEKAHRLMIWMLSKGLVPSEKEHKRLTGEKEGWDDTDIDLSVDAFGLKFSNVLGLAAGFDKHCEAAEGLLDLGFGFIEIGSVTPKPQSGNPKPRVFRLSKDMAVINRYGFNSDGHAQVFDRFQAAREASSKRQGLMGVNLGKNKTTENATLDYVEGVKKFARSADYLVINVSSPNTPGLRSLQDKGQLDKVIRSVNEARNEMNCSVPILVKVAPDLTMEEKAEIAHTALELKLDGLIISNTTISRPKSLQSSESICAETGGLSGEPLQDIAKETLADFYKLTKGSIPLVGVGGISSGKDALDRIKAGASLLQIYTALVYHGPPVVHTIKKELIGEMRREGFKSISEAVGADHRR